MNIHSTELSLTGMKFHARHGVFDHERKVGGEYVVDLTLRLESVNAVFTDHLEDSIDYAEVIQTVRDVMETPSSLIERVAGRIAEELLARFATIETGTVSVTKLRPPVPAVLTGAKFTLTFCK